MILQFTLKPKSQVAKKNKKLIKAMIDLLSRFLMNYIVDCKTKNHQSQVKFIKDPFLNDNQVL